MGVLSRRTLARARRRERARLGRAESRWGGFVAWFASLGLSENAILTSFAVVIGGLGALAVAAFYEFIDLSHALLYEWLGPGLLSRELIVYRPLLTGAGMFAAWQFLRRVGGPETRGPISSVQLVPFIQLASARRGGVIPVRSSLARVGAAAITLAGGGSAGSEGPVAMLSSILGSFLGRVFRFDPSRTRVLLGAGTAAGISAAFNAPLAGAFFALEEILGTFAVASFAPVVVSSVVAAVVSRAIFGDHPAFPIPHEYGYVLAREVFLLFPLLGVVAGATSALFVRIFFGTADLVQRSRIPQAALPWVGGALVGFLVVLSQGMLVGHGHLAFRLEVFGSMEWYWLALLALGGMVATSVTLSTGGSGGVFTPALFIGAASGGAFGVAMAALFPSWGIFPEAYSLVGMGAVVAAAAGAPIAAILIVFEMTNDYAIVLPLMVTVVIGFLVARGIERDSLYSGWLRRRGERLEHGASRDVLADLRVRDAYDADPQVIGESATIAQLMEHLGRGESSEFPVVDDGLRLVGMIGIAELGRVARDHRELAQLVLAADIATPTEVVSLNDSLLEAIRKMGVRGSGALPVVDPGTRRLLGTVTRAGILGLYERAVAGRRQAAEA